MIQWTKYDPYSREIESHINHLITDGINVWMAVHAKRINASGYGWHDPEDHSLLNLPVTHYSKINLPEV